MAKLCATFRKEAGIVWNRMRRAFNHGLSLSEEALTECSIYDIALAHQSGDIVIDLATKSEEAKHGADWEWWLVRGNNGLGFRAQAKRLFPNGRYQSLLKPGKKPYAQLELLISRALADDLVPLYCFFNFAHTSGKFAGDKNSCKHSYRGPSYWGCSLAFPEQIKAARSDKVSLLKPMMYPWHLLVCEPPKNGLVATAAAFVREYGRRREPPAPRALPLRVSRLIELADHRRRSDQADFVDDEYWTSIHGSPQHVSGLAIFRDLR